MASGTSKTNPLGMTMKVVRAPVAWMNPYRETVVATAMGAREQAEMDCEK
jgi:hypothetical protein